MFGPGVTPANIFPLYQPFDKQAPLSKPCDFTTEQITPSLDPSFSLVDRQSQTLKKSAVRSVKGNPKKKIEVPKRKSRFGVAVKPREPSLKIMPEWKMVEELDFKRMETLFLDVDEPTDLSTYGAINYYDKAMDKVNTKSETTLSAPSKTFYNPTASEDKTLLGYVTELEDSRTVVATDTVLAALMTCLKSVYSFDLILTKKGNTLIIDKRDGGVIGSSPHLILDIYSVNENAAETPVESLDKDTNINSHDALAFEAFGINKLYSQMILHSDRVVFDNDHPFVDKTSDLAAASMAYRYRKWDLGSSMSLVMRTHIHSAHQAKEASIIPDISKSDQTLDTTSLCNTYALHEFDHTAIGAGGTFEYRRKLESQKGAVIAREMKNNSVKLARWTMEAHLASVDYLRIGFVGRKIPKDRKKHFLFGSILYKRDDFEEMIHLNVGGGFGIVKTVCDVVFGKDDGTFVLLRDPVKPCLKLYRVK